MARKRSRAQAGPDYPVTAIRFYLANYGDGDRVLWVRVETNGQPPQEKPPAALLRSRPERQSWMRVRTAPASAEGWLPVIANTLGKGPALRALSSASTLNLYTGCLLLGLALRRDGLQASELETFRQWREYPESCQTYLREAFPTGETSGLVERKTRRVRGGGKGAGTMLRLGIGDFTIGPRDADGSLRSVESWLFLGRKPETPALENRFHRGVLPPVSAFKPHPFAVPYRSLGGRFRGRDELIWDLHAASGGHEGPGTPPGFCVLVCGVAGVGKSQLVIEYAHRFAEFYPGGIYWIDAEATPFDLVAEVLAAQLNTPLPVSLNAQLALDWLWEHLQRRTSSLVILDNFPDRASRIPELRHWLPKGSAVTVIVTARTGEPDRSVAVERVIVPPVDQLTAAALLSGRDVASDLPEEATACLADIFDRLPFALELAAAYLNARPTMLPSDLLAAIKARGVIPSLETLGTKYPAAALPSGRRPEIQALLESTWPEYPADRLALGSLSVLAQSGVPLEILQHVLRANFPCSDAMEDPAHEAISRLTAASLIRLDRGLVTVHSLVAEYARLRSEPGDAVRTSVEVAVLELLDHTEVSAARSESSSLANLLLHAVRLAEQAVDDQRWASLRLLACLLGECFHDLGRFEAAEKWGAWAYRATERVGLPGIDALAVQATTVWARTLQALGRSVEAAGVLSELFSKLRPLAGTSIDLTRAFLFTSLQLLSLHGRRGELGATVAVRETLLETVQGLGPDERAACEVDLERGLLTLAELHAELGEPDLAIRLLQPLVEDVVKDSSGSSAVWSAQICQSLGMAWLQIDPNAGLVYLERARLEFERAFGPDHPALGLVEQDVAVAHAVAGRFGDALQAVERAKDRAGALLRSGEGERACLEADRAEGLKTMIDAAVAMGWRFVFVPAREGARAHWDLGVRADPSPPREREP